MAYECPSCNRPLYNRQRATCEFRVVTVPEKLLLTHEQRVFLDRPKEDEAKHRTSFGSGEDRGGWVDVDDM